MIHSDEGLAVVREQLALAEHALEALRQDVPNERNFAVLSEGYVDQIAELRAEIKAYESAANKKSNVAKKRRLVLIARRRNKKNRKVSGRRKKPRLRKAL